MKHNIAIITGGYSGENVISYKSADTILKNIDNSLFNPILVDIRTEGWFAKKENIEVPVDKNDFSAVFNGEKVQFHCAWLALHGTPGEDGKMQGYLDMLDIPYSSGSTLNLSLTFNKKFTTSVLGNMGFTVARSMLGRKEDDVSATQILEFMSLPLFVKPNNGGSSIGISKVNNADQMIDALDKAFLEDDEIIIEEYIQGREFTCGVTYFDGKIMALPVTEIITENEFFDYQAKYEGKSKEITPAEITDDEKELIQTTAERIYKVLDCRGTVRIDFILKKNEAYVIEINTVPGMSEASIIPQQLKVAGIDLKAMITYSIYRAMEH